MKKFVVLTTLLVSLVHGVSIATGGKGGTYYPFGQQISQVCGAEIGGLKAISTGGSRENIKLLLNDPNVKFAIVQYDVLLRIQNSDQYSQKIKDRVKKLRVVLPLYNEGIHVILNKKLNINSLDDFKNLRVAVGKKSGGHIITARNIAKYTGARWAKTITANAEDSIKLITQGKLDAFFYVAGVPAKMFKVDASQKMFDIYKTNLKILDLGNETELDKIYSSSQITKKDYPWLDGTVNTKAVRSVLITYNYTKKQSSYGRVKRLYQCLNEKINYIKDNNSFHAKWKEVNPENFRNINWRVHPAVTEYLREKNHGNSSGRIDTLENNDKETKIIDDFFDNL